MTIHAAERTIPSKQTAAEGVSRRIVGEAAESSWVKRRIVVGEAADYALANPPYAPERRVVVGRISRRRNPPRFIAGERRIAVGEAADYALANPPYAPERP